jgi:hypothetical protein
MSTAALQQLNPLSDFGNVDCCPSAAQSAFGFWQCRLLPFSSLIRFRILEMSTAALQQLNPLSDLGQQ